MKQNQNKHAVAKPFYTSNKTIETTQRKETNESRILQLQQLAKQMERRYPKGYQGLLYSV